MLKALHCSRISTSAGWKKLEVLINSHEPFNIVVTLDDRVITEASRDRLSLEAILDIVKALDDPSRSKP